MSEYQRIAFRAIDGPVSEKELEYMRRQSSRAEITPWAFDNEYQFGDFHGNSLEMLRRGYDVHLHYANFGQRSLFIRLPGGLPDPEAAEHYLGDDAIRLVKDKQGPGCILAIEPCHEPGHLDDLWEIDELLERLIPLRAEILDGDLRPLYLAHLAMACDENHNSSETMEAPVPAGLEELTDAQAALAELYGLDDSLVAAAAQASPALPSKNDSRDELGSWIQRQPEATKNVWLVQWLNDATTRLRAQILAEFHKSKETPRWPTERRGRTIDELRTLAKGIHAESVRKAAEKKARERAKRLTGMAAEPLKTIHETEQLIAQRSTARYRQAAEQLADLREALAGSEHAGLAEQQARKLKSKHPKLNRLTSELRSKGFLGR